MISSSKMARGLMVVTVAINALGIGIVLPVMPELLKQVGNADIGRAAAIGGYLSLAFAGMQVLCGPLLGALSDRFGRRPVMVLSLIASALDYAVLATASVLWLFLAARLMSGAASRNLLGGQCRPGRPGSSAGASKPIRFDRRRLRCGLCSRAGRRRHAGSVRAQGSLRRRGRALALPPRRSVRCFCPRR